MIRLLCFNFAIFKNILVQNWFNGFKNLKSNVSFLNLKILGAIILKPSRTVRGPKHFSWSFHLNFIFKSSAVFEGSMINSCYFNHSFLNNFNCVWNRHVRVVCQTSNILQFTFNFQIQGFLSLKAVYNY